MTDTYLHGHPDQSAATKPHTRQAAIRCVFWHLYIWTSIKVFTNLSSSSSSIGSNYIGQPGLPISINEPWPPITLLIVLLPRSTLAGPDYCRTGTVYRNLGHPWPCWWLFILWSSSVRLDHCKPGTSHRMQFRRCSDPVIQPPLFGHCHISLNPYTCSFFCFQNINFRDKMFTYCFHIPPFRGVIVIISSVLLTLSVSGHNVMAAQCIGAMNLVWLELGWR